MDVVNHILQEMMFGRYRDDMLDHVFIDEVQDLTPATIYLITKLTKKNIFYCGDTAQAISKGVTFKFSEIKSLFSKSYFKHYIEKDISKEEKHLTVNFRSHNRILMLANAIVSMMKELFPNTIDVLKEERSDLVGPHNYLIDNGDERLIYDLLVGPTKEYNQEELERQEMEVL
jgi:superfamily I DNA/RNA helicase